MLLDSVSFDEIPEEVEEEVEESKTAEADDEVAGKLFYMMNDNLTHDNNFY